MLSGHILLKILIGFAWAIASVLSFLSPIWVVLSLFPLLIVFMVTILEVLIAFLQAYVFFVLLVIYLQNVISLH
jgi:F0F1-type ATP synthase membrane subunit a